MSTGSITWNGFSSTDFGVYVSGTNAHNAAEADVTAYEVPGRNGNLIISNNRYKNIEVSYPAFIPASFAVNEQGIRNWLRQTGHYLELRDTYDTTHFRLAHPVGELVFTPARPNAANFEIVFDCDPRRFLNSGDTDVEILNGYDDSLENPTQYTARPFFTVEGVTNGLEIEVADSTSSKVYTLTATDDYSGTVVIDSETQNIYNPSTGANLNELFDLSDGFPEITDSAAVTITITGAYTAAYITPRWWEL